MSAAGPILPQVSNLVNDIRYIRVAGLRIPCDFVSWMAQCVIGTRLRARGGAWDAARGGHFGGRRAPAGRDGGYRESAHRSGRFGPIFADASPVITIPNGHAGAGVPDRPEPPARAHFLACGSRAQPWRGFRRWVRRRLPVPPSRSGGTSDRDFKAIIGADFRIRAAGASRPSQRGRHRGSSPLLRRRTLMQAPLLG